MISKTLIRTASQFLKELERKANYFLDQLLGLPHYIPETILGARSLEEISPVAFYFYNPPRREPSRSEKELTLIKTKYLEYTDLQTENCSEITLTRINRVFRQWIEWIISLTHPNLVNIDREYGKRKPNSLNMEDWESKQLRNFKRTQVKVIARKEAFIITQTNSGEWRIFHIRMLTSRGQSRLIVKDCHQSVSDQGPRLKQITKHGKMGYQLEVENWKTTALLAIDK